MTIEKKKTIQFYVIIIFQVDHIQMSSSVFEIVDFIGAMDTWIIGE